MSYTIRRMEFEACGPEDVTGKFPATAAFVLRGTLGVHSTVLRSPFAVESGGLAGVFTWVKDPVGAWEGTRTIYYVAFPAEADIDSRWTYVNTIMVAGDAYHLCQSST
jgi:hypothetical protein